MARTRDGKIAYQSQRAMTGKNFKAGSLEEAYPRAALLRKRVNQYFDDCDANGKHYSVPGLGLFLGLRTRIIINFNNDTMEFEEHRRIIDYAMQRIETYVAERLFETKGSTKGTEFLLQNTLGYANKSDISSKQSVEVTEKERIKSLPDAEVEGRLVRLVPRIREMTKGQKSG